MRREPWREAILEIESNESSNIGVVFAFDKPFSPWEWYSNGNIPAYSLQHTSVADPLFNWNVITPALAHDTVFLFEYLMDLTDPNRDIESYFEQQGYTETGFLQYPGIGKVKLLSKNNVYANRN